MLRLTERPRKGSLVAPGKPARLVDVFGNAEASLVILRFCQHYVNVLGIRKGNIVFTVWKRSQAVVARAVLYELRTDAC